MKNVINVDDLQRLMHSALSLRGVNKDVADFMVTDYIEAELSGQPSHGLSKFLLLDAALQKKEGDVELIKEVGNYAKVDGHKELGHVAGMFCVNKALELAQKLGNGFVALNNASRYSRVKPFAQRIAESGYIGIVLNNGGPAAVAPYNGTTPIFGTNPICFSFPSVSGRPYVFDFSTSKKVWAEIRQAILEKRGLPEDSFYDEDGNITTDLDKAVAVQPFGGAKGYALCYAVEILTGAFVGGKMGSKVNDEYDLGFLFIALDPEMFTDSSRFKAEVDSLAQEVKSSRSVPGGSVVYVPGERSSEVLYQNSQTNVIAVNSDILERIKMMAVSLDGGIESNSKLN